MLLYFGFTVQVTIGSWLILADQDDAPKCHNLSLSISIQFKNLRFEINLLLEEENPYSI